MTGNPPFEVFLPGWMPVGIFRFLCPVCNEFQTAVNPLSIRRPCH